MMLIEYSECGKQVIGEVERSPDLAGRGKGGEQ